jgi:hypothetical protein
MTKKRYDSMASASMHRFRDEPAVDDFPNHAADSRRLPAVTQKLRMLQSAMKALRRDLFGAAESGSTPQALFEDRLLARLGLVRGQPYPEEEITTRLRQASITDATERLAAKVELEQMGMIEGYSSRSSQELKAQALGLRRRPLSGLARYGIDDSGAYTYTEAELDALLQPWNLDPTVRIGLKAEASVWAYCEDRGETMAEP